MSKGQMLRALVNKRLAAAAEEIFVLFERTIVEYEEELCRSKEENQRKQLLLDRALVRGNVQVPSASPNRDLNQEITETQRIKEETEKQDFKLEEDHLPVCASESSAVCVKTDDPLQFQQRHTEYREEPQGEDTSSEPHFHSEIEGHTENSRDTDDEDEMELPFSWSADQMETEANGDGDRQLQTRGGGTELFLHHPSAPEATVHNEDVSGADEKKYQCPVCTKGFVRKDNLQRHFRIHTGEKPFSCPICQKPFTNKSGLDAHIRAHTGERPYSCPVCEKTFTVKSIRDLHMRIHTGEKPYSCTMCDKSFVHKGHLERHRKTHTGPKPFSCPVCEKVFSQKHSLDSHMVIHRGQSSTSTDPIRANCGPPDPSPHCPQAPRTSPGPL